MWGDRDIAGVVGFVAACFAVLFAPALAKGEEAPYVFDPVISLTGSCSPESAEDPVPDPAEPPCPSKEGAHPPNPFNTPRSVATDAYGDIFVPNTPVGNGIDIFSPDGYFLDHLSGGLLSGMEVEDVALDFGGRLYAYGYASPESMVIRFDPGPGYDPEKGKIPYLPPVKVLDASDGLALLANSIALDGEGRLYVDKRKWISVYGSAAEGNVLIEDKIGEGGLIGSRWLTVDSRNGDIYASSHVEEPGGSFPSVIKVFSGAKGHSPTRTISGFSSQPIAPAVDEATGRVLVGDILAGSLPESKKVYVFPESTGDQSVDPETPIVQHEFQASYETRVAIDNGANSPNGGYLFVPSEAKAHGAPYHVYAFEPIKLPTTPQVKSVTPSDVTENEAQVEAVINPGNAKTTYKFEYATEEAFEANGFVEAAVAGEGTIAAGSQDVAVSASISGLSPETTYRVRVVAENCSLEEPERECIGEAEASFTTYPEPEPVLPCPNDALRAGPSAHLPDCRAYELVTPSDTGGRPPVSVGVLGGDNRFGTPTATADGANVSFAVLAGGIPGLGGAGSYSGNGYLAVRHPSGWHTQLKGPSGKQLANPEAGGLSPDHGFAVWTANALGSVELEGGGSYVLYPDGSFHQAGRGSLGETQAADVRTITEAGGHMIFRTEQQLEPQAPPTGTKALYDRTIDPLTGEEMTHVVSLLPGDETPAAGKGATYEGSSADGTAIAFKLGNPATSPLYARIDNAETLIATEEPGAEFAGFSSDGRYLFYELEGDLFRFDTVSEETDAIVESGDALMVNVPAKGTSAYFVSQSVLAAEEENSQGAKAVAGEWNLYVWNGEGISFIATVTDRDVEGGTIGNNIESDGLGLWAFSSTEKPVTDGQTSRDPSRTIPDGSVLLFESRANLTGYDSGEHAEIYRFVALSGDLRCLSCSPTGSLATGDAALLSVGATFTDGPVKRFALVPNLRADGKRAFFESVDPLVLADTDNTRDVYEWEEEGVGSCEKPGGCVYLISSGHSPRPNYLYGVSASGDDVFFITSVLLVGEDHDQTPSIYDARVGGGIPEPETQICEEEGCLPPVTASPQSPSPASPASDESGNVKEHKPRRCPKGKRKVKRNGKVRCVKRHHKHKRHRHSGDRQ